MALTKVSTDGVKDDAITKTKIPANQIEASELADNAVDTNAIADQAVALSKLPHGTSSNDGKFLRANNGADPTFETVNTDLVSDTSPQLGGDLDVNNFNVLFADSTNANNDRLKFGASADLSIYHNGNHSFIEESGTGALKVLSSNIQLLNAAGNETMIQGTQNGSVELYHDNGIRLTTTSTGINVTQLGSSFSNFHHGGGASGVRIAGPAAASSANLVFANNFDNSVSDEWAISLDGATDDLVFKSEGAGGTDRIRFLDNGGICFGSDTATANALDDYEEGTFTPTVHSGLSNPSLSRAKGSYVKIGRQVLWQMHIIISGGTANANQLMFGGLPFTSRNDANLAYGGAWLNYQGGTFTQGADISFHTGINETVIKCYTQAGGNLAGNSNDVADISSEILWCGQYIV